MIIPDKVVKYVVDAPEGEARCTANTIGRDAKGEPTALVVIMNPLAIVSLFDALGYAAKGKLMTGDEPTAEQKEAWLSLTMNLSAAVRGAIVS